MIQFIVENLYSQATETKQDTEIASLMDASVKGKILIPDNF